MKNAPQPGPWHRVTKRRPCPICGKPDWCLVSADGAAVICPRVEQGSTKRCGDAGWLHRLHANGNSPRRHAVRFGIEPRASASGNFDRLGEQYQRALARSSKLCELAACLGVSESSLSRLGVGWSPRDRAWAFPMRDGRGRTVGLKRRYASGAKRSVRGSKEGLFLPIDLPAKMTGEVLAIAEGPSDTAAALDFGLVAVGRPSCTGGAKFLVDLAKARKPAEAVILADRDPEGMRGAARLASALVCHVSQVKIVIPPHGVKDVRAWKRAGASRTELEAAVKEAPVHRLTVRFGKATNHGRRQHKH